MDKRGLDRLKQGPDSYEARRDQLAEMNKRAEELFDRVQGRSKIKSPNEANSESVDRRTSTWVEIEELDGGESIFASILTVKIYGEIDRFSVLFAVGRTTTMEHYQPSRPDVDGNTIYVDPQRYTIESEAPIVLAATTEGHYGHWIMTAHDNRADSLDLIEQALDKTEKHDTE